MLNLSKNRQKLLRFHGISKPNFRILKGTFNGRIFQLNRSGTRNAAKTKQISVRVTSVQVINIGNAGHVRNIVRTSFNNRNLQSRKETRSISNEDYEKLKNDSKKKDRDSICKLAVKRMLERIRKKTKKSIRHWFITELGENTGRIHHHGIS